MKLNFKNDKYKDLALNLKLEENSIHSPEEAFFLLINGYDYESLDNLCSLISHYYYLDEEASYQLTQDLNLDKENKKVIMNLAKECISLGMPLGTKLTSDGKFFTTAWIAHCIYVGEVCSNLANILGLNESIARTLGLLHDYGRRIDHSFNHVIGGFQTLTNLGWNSESIACLTHSFLNGGRCSNNEKATEGFYVDELGNPQWLPDTIKDDVTLFLENYTYTEYDLILNIADLMGTSECVLSPYERIQDISTRKILDPVNRGYFLSELTNILIDFLKKTNYIKEDYPYIKATKNTSLIEIENNFKVISNYFYNMYLELSNPYTIKQPTEEKARKRQKTKVMKKLSKIKNNE